MNEATITPLLLALKQAAENSDMTNAEIVTVLISTHEARKIQAALYTLASLRYTYLGGTAWKPPIGTIPDYIDRTYEQMIAEREGHCIAASDAYFDARPNMKLPGTEKAFAAGFERACSMLKNKVKS
jgi:hypothetical protein